MKEDHRKIKLLCPLLLCVQSSKNQTNFFLLLLFLFRVCETHEEMQKWWLKADCCCVGSIKSKCKTRIILILNMYTFVQKLSNFLLFWEKNLIISVLCFIFRQMRHASLCKVERGGEMFCERSEVSYCDLIDHQLKIVLNRIQIGL